MYTISEIAAIINAKTAASAVTIEHILVDSRRLLFPDTTLFFALKGPRRDGSIFVEELYNKSVHCFVVDEDFNPGKIKKIADAVFLQVPNVLQALHTLTAHHRSRFSFPVIGITGSNGKTIVKEWLYQLLQPGYNVIRSPRSYNSQIGVPQSIWLMNEKHELGIFEAGISQPNEMQHLATIIKPTIGVLTNIGDAHNEGFIDVNEKINEKLKLFANSDVLIFGSDNQELNTALEAFKNKINPQLKLFSRGRKDSATLQIVSVEKTNSNTTVNAKYKAEQLVFTIPFTDAASIENALTCCCVLLYTGVAATTILERMLQLKPVEMRLELKQGINNCSVINDSYSNDINSFAIALDFLQMQQQHEKRTLILSDILQSGKTGQNLYDHIASIIEKKNVNRFIGIGPQISKYKDAFKNLSEKNFYTSTGEFKQQFHSQHFHNETILIKGARVFEFEQISHLLESKTHQTVLEVNLDAVTHNLNAYKKLLNPGVKLMAMVKAFSYGSGGFEIANILQFHHVDYLAVAYADEAVELRKAGITLPIMVMNVEAVTFDILVQHNLEPELFSIGILTEFENYLKQNGISNYPVHLKLDTGMRRLGFEPKDITELSSKLKTSAVFKVQSVFSHLAASDSVLHDDFTNAQAASFLHSCEVIQKATGYTFIKHIANTAAIHRHKKLQFDMIRLGIGLYGVDADPAIQLQLKNVTTLKTTISQIKSVAAGESIGYSRKGIAAKDSQIATVRIGYADGYPRLLSNGIGKMWIKGKTVPVIGNVCMDMTMLDVTDVDAREGDEVIVFGAQFPVNELAILAKSIPYEILTGISQRVKRIYFEE